jgi:hypothetical protein
MNRYMVTRQRKNCGPTQEIFVKTIAEARRAFDIAVEAGDQFAEIFDMNMDAQVLLHLTPATHTRY